MTELEIINFAYDFVNIIKEKNTTIQELNRKIQELLEQIRMETPTKLTREEVNSISCPVWVVPQNSKNGFYALPVNGGVITAEGGRYRLDNYDKTWVAYSTRPVTNINEGGFKTILKDNLRYSIGNVIIDKYGVYNEENLAKLSNEMGVTSEDLECLTRSGLVTEENFKKICAYLKPEKELQEIWRKFYIKSLDKENYKD